MAEYLTGVLSLHSRASRAEKGRGERKGKREGVGVKETGRSGEREKGWKKREGMERETK